MITVKSEMQRIYKEAGIEYSENDNQNVDQEKVEKSIAELKKEIVDGAISGDEAAYAAYGRIEKKEADSRLRIAKAEIASVIEEVNAIRSKDIRKGNESEAAQDARIWSTHTDLFNRFSNAQRALDNLR